MICINVCSDQLVPKAVEALRGKQIVLISGGWRHTAAADDSGKLYAWGWNKVLHEEQPLLAISHMPPLL
jgi:alpha-tubulin suppressor-like RCC1 family protein